MCSSADGPDFGGVVTLPEGAGPARLERLDSAGGRREPRPLSPALGILLGMAIVHARREAALMRKELTPATVAFSCAEVISDREARGKFEAGPASPGGPAGQDWSHPCGC